MVQSCVYRWLMPIDCAAIMKVAIHHKDKLVLSLINIDFIKLEEMAAGKAMVKVGTGGVIHHLEYDTKEEASAFYESIIQEIREL